MSSSSFDKTGPKDEKKEGKVRRQQSQQQQRRRRLVANPPLNLHNFMTLQPERFDYIYLHDANDNDDGSTTTTTSSSSTAPNNNDGDESNPTHFRYRLTIIDRPPPTPTPHTSSSTIHHACAVVLIPMGRETEYIFATKNGLHRSILTSAKCLRLIAVAFGRSFSSSLDTTATTKTKPHDNPVEKNDNHEEDEDSQQRRLVQEELRDLVRILGRPIMMSYSPPAAKNNDSYTTIPFMAVDGMGSRNVIAQGETPTTGPFVVEEVRKRGKGGGGDGHKWVRRLYFMKNPNVIQTEVALRNECTVRAHNEHDGGGGNSKNNNNNNSSSHNNNGKDSVVDTGYLSFEYHRQMAAGLISLSALCSSSSSSTGSASSSSSGNKGQTPQDTVEHNKQEGLIIGLGGGGLTNFLCHFLSHVMKLTVVELDEGVLRIAKEYFAVTEGEGMHVIIGDGLNVCRSSQDEKNNNDDEEEEEEEVEAHVPSDRVVAKDTDTEQQQKGGQMSLRDRIPFEPNSLTMIAIDVDSKDATVGMSCPPVSFVSVPYLSGLRSLLHEQGVLAINVSARDPAMLDLVKKNASEVFTSVFISQSDSDEEEEEVGLNVVLFAKKSNFALPDKRKRSELVNRLRGVMTSCGGGEKNAKEMISGLEDCVMDLTTISKTGDVSAGSRKTSGSNKNDKKKGGGGKGRNKKKGKRK